MQMNLARPAIAGHGADPLRTCVHDLRNLFAVVASAKWLLERPLDESRLKVVLDALGQVSAEGKKVTDALLGGGTEDAARGSTAATELRKLESIFKTLGRPGVNLELSFDDDAVRIPIAPADFRAVALELVTNAKRAGARRITVHAARRGDRYWLVVADDGAGFGAVTKLPRSVSASGLHGTGMRRVAAAIGAADGKVRIKSTRGRGSVVAVILPVVGPTRLRNFAQNPFVCAE